jgi:hypothetical protein
VVNAIAGDSPGARADVTAERPEIPQRLRRAGNQIMPEVIISRRCGGAGST